MKKKLLLLAMTGLLFFSCGEDDTSLGYNKEELSGTELPVTMENLMDEWTIHKAYSDYRELTEISPSLTSGYLSIREDSCFFCQNPITGMPEYEGIIDADSINHNIVWLELNEGEDDTEEPLNVRLQINKLTDRQMDVTWMYYDPSYGAPGEAELLLEYTFENGSLAPTIYKEGLMASDVEIGAQNEWGTPDNPNQIAVTGWVTNINQQQQRNINFHLYADDYIIAVDSVSFVGYRLPETINNSRIQLSTSNISVQDLTNNGAFYDLPKDGTEEDVPLELARLASGKSIYFGITANISNNGTLHISELRVYGKFTRGEPFKYDYIFNRK